MHIKRVLILSLVCLFVRVFFPAVHRLDRVTSGLLLLSLTRSNASVLSKEFSERCVTKTYVARVSGEFPQGRMVVKGKIKLRGEGGGGGNGKNCIDKKEHQDCKDGDKDNNDDNDNPQSANDSSSSAPMFSIQPANPFMSSRVPARVHMTTVVNVDTTHTPTTNPNDDTTQRNPSPDPPPSSSSPSSSAINIVNNHGGDGDTIVQPQQKQSEDVSSNSNNNNADDDDDNSKASSTEFERISYDGCTSLVRCQ